MAVGSDCYFVEFTGILGRIRHNVEHAYGFVTAIFQSDLATLIRERVRFCEFAVLHYEVRLSSGDEKMGQ